MDTPVSLELGRAIYTELSPRARAQGGWQAVGRRLANDFREKTGFPVSYIPIVEGDGTIGEMDVRLRERGVVSLKMSVPKEAVSARGSTSQLLETIIQQACDWLVMRAGRLLGVDETENLVENISKSRPVLVRETVPKRIGLPCLSGLLASLLDERLSLDHLVDILEALTRAPKTEDIELLTENIRAQLAPVITARLLGDQNKLDVLVLDSDLTSVLEEALSPTSSGTRLALPLDLCEQIIDACRSASREQTQSIVVVASHLRRPLAGLLANALPSVEVVAHDEIEQRIPVEIVGKVEI
jgi:flagellar biosynthesis component FlhA